MDLVLTEETRLCRNLHSIILFLLGITVREREGLYLNLQLPQATYTHLHYLVSREGFFSGCSVKNPQTMAKT